MESSSVVTKKVSKFIKNGRRYWVLGLMALPGVLYFLINNYLPMFGIVVAFKNVNYVDGILKSPWVGFKNFEFLFKTPDAFTITRNTVLYNLTFIILNMLLAVGLAILINEVGSSRITKVCQSTFVIPFMVSFTVVGYVVYAFLHPDYGIANSLLETFGVEPTNWYMEIDYWPYILTFINQWKYVGYLCVIYIAAIVGIDVEYYEAAVIDGAGRWDRIRFITVPMIKTVIITMTFIQVGRIFYADFGLFYQTTLNTGILYPVTDVIDTYVYRSLLKTGEIGLASAAGFYQSLVGFVVILAANLAIKKISREDALF